MESLGEFTEMIARLPRVLKNLQDGPALNRLGLRGIPERGIYAFYLDDRPMYVGRSSHMKDRLLNHGRPSSDHNSATFAFILAVNEAKKRGIDTSSVKRATLQHVPAFKKIYSQAKKDVSAMEIRVTEVSNPIEQTVFEVYAAVALDTPHNVFENH